MRKRVLAVSILLPIIATTCLAGGDPNIGTWKLDEARSQVPRGSIKELTVAWATVGDNVKVTTDGIDANGKPIHTEWVGKYDGNYYPLVGDVAADRLWYARISDRTLALNATKNGKVTRTGRIDVSADGKTRTVVTTNLDEKGFRGSAVQVYDRQQ